MYTQNVQGYKTQSYVAPVVPQTKKNGEKENPSQSLWLPFSKKHGGNLSMNSKLPPQSHGAPATARGERHSYKRPSFGLGNRTSSIGCLGHLDFERKSR